MILMTCITGCSAFNRIHGFNDRDYAVTVVKNARDLEDKAFYVLKEDGTYHRLYIGETSYKKNSGFPTNPSSKRVAWFGKDYERIPTMYKGECIAYRSSTEFSEQFNIERYEDIGYTIGICNMSESSTGRFKFSTKPDDMQIDIDASTGILYQLGPHTATIERIGEVDLRTGNISRAGTVVGLERGKTYTTDVYIGTDVNRYSFIADVRAMVSMELYGISDYTYMQGKTVTFSFPEWYNSGYYCVNGFGIVRYIASNREFTESMDMNIPNSEFSTDQSGNGLETTPDAVNDIERIPFRIDEETPVRVQVLFEPEKGGKDGYGAVPDPTARILAESAAYALSPGADGELLVDMTLPAGDYTLEITGLNGRDYTYRVTKRGY